MKVSSPSSYGNIFSVYTGGATTLTGYTMPAHRGLFIASTTTALNGITFENIDGTTTNVGVVANAPVVLPIVVKKITVATAVANLRIYGLL
jgi:hypothetical protein